MIVCDSLKHIEEGGEGGTVEDISRPKLSCIVKWMLNGILSN